MKGGEGRRQAYSRRVGGGSEALEPIQGFSGPSDYFLLSVGGKVGADKNGGDGGSFGGGGSGSVIIRPPHCVTETSVHGCVIVYI